MYVKKKRMTSLLHTLVNKRRKRNYCNIMNERKNIARGKLDEEIKSLEYGRDLNCLFLNEEEEKE